VEEAIGTLSIRQEPVAESTTVPKTDAVKNVSICEATVPPVYL